MSFWAKVQATAAAREARESGEAYRVWWAVVTVTLAPGGIRQEITDRLETEAAAERLIHSRRAERPFLTDYYTAPDDERLQKTLQMDAKVGRR